LVKSVNQKDKNDPTNFSIRQKYHFKFEKKNFLKKKLFIRKLTIFFFSFCGFYGGGSDIKEYEFSMKQQIIKKLVKTKTIYLKITFKKTKFFFFF
jgi:hypothetical protein